MAAKCSACGQPVTGGHNARTCGRGPSVPQVGVGGTQSSLASPNTVVDPDAGYYDSMMRLLPSSQTSHANLVGNPVLRGTDVFDYATIISDGNHPSLNWGCRVTDSVVRDEGTVICADVTRSVIGGNGEVGAMSVVKDSQIDGNAYVEGNITNCQFGGTFKAVCGTGGRNATVAEEPGYGEPNEISNITMNVGYIQGDAKISKRSHIAVAERDGVQYTKYRTGAFSHAYTAVTRFSDGSVKYERLDKPTRDVKELF